MRLVRAHLGAQLREYARHPAFVVPTLAFPSMFFLFFVTPRADAREADVLMATYAAFAVLAIAFFQFGVGVAAERTSPWETYLRTLPVGATTRFAARSAAALVFATIAAAVLIGVALATTPADLSAERWLRLALTLAGGAVPFALLGIAIGYWTPPRAALPIANVLYLGLAFIGGLWTAPDELPRSVDRLSQLTPTRHWAETLVAAVEGRGPGLHAVWLAAFGVISGALAVLGYRRDEGEHFR